MSTADLDPPTDDAIVERVLAGEVDRYQLLMRRHNRRLYRAVRAVLGRVDDDEVLDVVQDAFVRAYVHLGAFEGRSQFSTWLTRIAVNEALALAPDDRRARDLGRLDEYGRHVRRADLRAGADDRRAPDGRRSGH